MPRPRNPSNETARRRTEVWRESRLLHGRPESSIIDRAIAASVATFFSADFDDEGLSVGIVTILDGAERILLSKGFDRRDVRIELERRLSRRADLPELQKICGVAD